MARGLRCFAFASSVVTVVTLSGCMKSMVMPSEQVSWTALDAGAPHAKHIVLSKSVELNQGQRDFWARSARANGDESVIAFAGTAYWDAPRDVSLKVQGRQEKESGIALWGVGGSWGLEWAAIPSVHGEDLGDDPRVLAFSTDSNLVAVERDERVSVWSRPERRILSTFKYGAGEKLIRLEHGGSERRPTASIKDVSFSLDGSSVRASTSPGGWVEWSTTTGELISREAPGESEKSNTTIGRDESGLQGMGRNAFVSDQRSKPVVSDDGEYLAIAFFGGVYFMGQGDYTPAHVRVWHAPTGKLTTWGMKDDRGLSDDSIGFRFLPGSHVLLICSGRDARLVDVNAGQEIDHETTGVPLLWLSRTSELVCEHKNGAAKYRLAVCADSACWGVRDERPPQRAGALAGDGN